MKMNKEYVDKINEKLEKRSYMFHREYQIDNGFNGTTIDVCTSKNDQNSTWVGVIGVEKISELIEDLENIRDCVKEITGCEF